MPAINARYVSIIKMWLKILHSKPEKYIYIIYKTLYQDVEVNHNRKNWCSFLRDTLFNLGFVDAWMSQTVRDSKFLLLLIKQRIKDQFLQGWRGRLVNSNRSTFYRSTCISDFCLQPYLDILHGVKFRKTLSCLRVSSHRLCVETGRSNKTNNSPLNERICTICNKPEGEYHVLMECQINLELRKEVIPKCFQMRLLKKLLEKKKLLITSNFSFSHNFLSAHLENFVPFSSNLKLSSANAFSF